MVKGTDRAIVLLPIMPQYAELIRAGSKTIEFRKRGFLQDVSHVVLYETMPIKKITAFFSVEDIVTASPSSLWRRYRTVGGITKCDYDDYYEGSTLATGILIDTVDILDAPVSLSDLGIHAPPRSHRYLSAEQWSHIREGNQS